MVCPTCGSHNPDNFKFCSECGAMLAGRPVETSVHSAEDLRRISAIFSDLSGYTAMSEHLGPEETKAITSRIFSEAAAIAKKYDGRLDRLIGDCALILFGIPHLHEDDAIRALMTAMEIHVFVDSLNSPELVARIGRSLAMHTGVNTGTVVAGRTDFEAGTETVVGDAVNLASRLKDAARPGRILVGPSTWRHTREAFEYRTLEPLSLKGKGKPIQAFELLSRKGKVAWSRREAPAREVHSELVGRDQELDQLEHQALKLMNGEGSIVLVTGEAGVGKSRLLGELRKKELMERVTLLEGSSQSIGRNLSFHPFIEMLNMWAGVREEDGAAEAGSKLEAAIQGAAPEDANEIFPFVAVMRRLRLTGEHEERVRGIEGDVLTKHIFKSLRDLLRTLSKRKPIVIILEDLHWADQSSLDLLESLLTLVEKERALFLLTLRPSEAKAEGLVRSVRKDYAAHSLEIVLSALGIAESEQMVLNLLRSAPLPKHIAYSTGERTGGNPFFIEEIVRSWIDEGAVKATKSGFQITERIEQSVIPYTIHQAIMSRIDRLEEEKKDILRIASVIGRNFFLRILARMVGNPESIDAMIEALKEMQLILERETMGEVEFQFKHALVQQAIYDSLLIQVRKRLHLSVVQAIESLFENRIHEFYGVLAFHYIQAEQLDKAEGYLVLAGDSMLASSASSEAIYYYQEGLALYLKKNRETVDRLTVARLEKSLALAFYNKGSYPEAVSHFESALAHLGFARRKGAVSLFNTAAGIVSALRLIYLPRKQPIPLPDAREKLVIDIMPRMALALYSIDNKRFIIEFLSTIRFLTRYDIEGIYPKGFLLSNLIVVVAFVGFVKLGRRLLERPEMQAEYAGSDGIYNLCAHLEVSLFDGNWNARQFMEFQEPSAYKCEFIFIVDSLAYCALVEIEKAQFAQVEKRIGQLSYIAEEFKNDHARGCYYEIAAKYLLKRGKAEEAIALEQKAKSFLEHFELGLFGIYFHGLKAKALLMLHRCEECELSLKEAEGLIRKTAFIPPHFNTRYAISRFALEVARIEGAVRESGNRGRVKQNKKAFKTGMAALACSKKWIGDRTEALRLMGTYFWLRGKRTRALRYWRESMDLGERIGARLELSRTWMEVGRRLLEKGNGAGSLGGVGAGEYLSKAEAFFHENDLSWDLANLEITRNN